MADNPLANLAQQQNPDTYDPSKSLMDNTWDMTGYSNPGGDVFADVQATGEAAYASQEAPSEMNAGYANEISALAAHYTNEYRAGRAEEEDFIPAFEKAVYASENFGDNIGTWFQVNSSMLAQRLGSDYWSDLLATDWQMGLVGTSSRGGNTGLYFDSISPDKIYGEDWRTQTREERYDNYNKFRAKQIEEFYGDVGRNEAGEMAGFIMGEMILDSLNIVPTGAVGISAKLISKGAGKTAAQAAAGSVVGAAWAAGDSAMQQHVLNQEMDPANVMKAAVFGGVVGAFLPMVGSFLNDVVTRFRKTGNPATPLEIDEMKLDSLESYDRRIKEIESAPTPKDATEAEMALATLQRLKGERAALGSVPVEDVARAYNKATAAGSETDSAYKIDDALRLAAGRADKSIEYRQFIEKQQRKGKEWDYQKSKRYQKLSDAEKKIVDRDNAKVNGTLKPDKKAKSKKVNREEVVAAKEAEILEETSSYMDQLAAHSKEHAYNVLQHVTSTSAAAAAGGGLGYAATGDPERAMYWALTTGGIAMGAPIARKMYGGMTNGREMLLSPNLADRKRGAELVMSNWFKATAAGQGRVTNNNLTTQPIRQHNNRGGASRVGAEYLRSADESYKLHTATDLTQFGNIMARNNISQKETPIISKLLTKQLDEKSPNVKPEHVAAYKDMRKLYDNMVDRFVKQKILTKAKGAELQARAKKEGYLNRVYDTAYMASKKGSKAFIDRVAAANITNDQALKLVQTLTGVTAKQAREELKLVANLNNKGEFTGFTRDGVRRLVSSSGGSGLAQPAKFLERERKIPTELEDLLDPFLVRDLRAVFTQYVDSGNKRLAYAEKFGNNNEVAEAIQKSIDKEWGADSGYGAQFVSDVLGAQHSPANEWIKRYFDQDQFFKLAKNPVAHIQNSKLLLSAPLNFTQHLIYLPTMMSRMGLTSKILPKMTGAYKEGMKEIADEASRRGRTGGKAFTDRFGVLTENITYSVTGDVASHQANARRGSTYGLVPTPDIWLRLGFAGAERWNRRAAGHVGQAIVDDTISRRAELLAKRTRSSKENGEVEHLEAIMIELGLNPKTHPRELTIGELETAGNYIGSSLMNGGVLRDINDPAARAMAAQRVSNKSNFQSGYLHKPRWWSTPYGQWFGKFRSFMLHGTHFITDEVIKPLGRGNALPAATFFLTSAPLGMGVNEIKNLIANDDPEYSNTKKLFEGWMAAGALGAWGEGAITVANQPNFITGTVFGPVYNDTIKAMTKAATALSEGDVNKLATDLGSMLAPVRYGAAVQSNITNQPNPFAYKEEKHRKDVLKELGL